MSVDSLALNGIATYECIHGYIRTSGNASRVCDGYDWLGEDIICQGHLIYTLELITQNSEYYMIYDLYKYLTSVKVIISINM